MRFPDSRPVLAATLLAGLALTACSSSGGDDKQTQTPSRTAPTSSTSSTAVSTLPLIVEKVTSKQNAAVIKVVPLLAGVQNTSYNAADKTLRVFVRTGISTIQRTVIVNELRKLTGRTPTSDTEKGPTTAPSTPASSSPSSTKTS